LQNECTVGLPGVEYALAAFGGYILSEILEKQSCDFCHLEGNLSAELLLLCITKWLQWFGSACGEAVRLRSGYYTMESSSACEERRTQGRRMERKTESDRQNDRQTL